MSWRKKAAVGWLALICLSLLNLFIYIMATDSNVRDSTLVAIVVGVFVLMTAWSVVTALE